MVEDRLTDGVRIAQLLSSEITGDAGRLRELQVTDADPDVEATVDGELAYRIVLDDSDAPDDGDGDDVDPGDDDDSGDDAGDGDSGDVGDDGDGDNGDDVGNGGDGGDREIATVHVQPDRARLEFSEAPEVAAEVATEAGLRVRPTATRPPRTIVFLEDGAQVKWVLSVLESVLESVRASSADPNADRNADA